ncbi:MAG: hypothetical protein E6I04_09265 [Chloroflexi bacterium]|nr:MAG: hypothetical protein E6I04_09265 [Chloroflexota bacterium]
MGRKRITIVVICVLIIGIIGYAGVSVLYTAFRVNAAERTVVAVVSHQNNLNVTFAEIDSQVSALNGSAAFDSEQALTLVDRSIAGSRAAVQSIDKDDASLRREQDNLRAMLWLSLTSRDGVERAASKIGYARSALAIARTVAAYELLDGQFWRALYAGLADFTTLSTQASAGDIAGARVTLAKMKGEIDSATGLASAPGLPSEMRALMADLQKFAADFGKKLEAMAANDYEAALDAEAVVESDASKIATYDIDKIGGEIDAFYKPMIDRYNAELSAATG